MNKEQQQKLDSLLDSIRSEKDGSKDVVAKKINPKKLLPNIFEKTEDQNSEEQQKLDSLLDSIRSEKINPKKLLPNTSEKTEDQNSEEQQKLDSLLDSIRSEKINPKKLLPNTSEKTEDQNSDDKDLRKELVEIKNSINPKKLLPNTSEKTDDQNSEEQQKLDSLLDSIRSEKTEDQNSEEQQKLDSLLDSIRSEKTEDQNSDDKDLKSIRKELVEIKNSVNPKKLLPNTSEKTDDQNSEDQNSDDKDLKSIRKELVEIKNSVNTIVESFKKKNQLAKSSIEKQRQQKNIQRKKSRESSLESKSDVKKEEGKIQKAISPFADFFEKVMNFFKFILLGGFLKGLLNIIKNPLILLKPLQNIINGVVGFFNGIIEWIDDNIIGPIRSFIDLINGGIKNVVNTINDIINKLPSWLPKPDPIDDPPTIPQIPNLPQIPEATFANDPEKTMPVVAQFEEGGEVQNINNYNNYNNYNNVNKVTNNVNNVTNSANNVTNNTIKSGSTVIPRNRSINVNDLSFAKGGQIENDTGLTISGLGKDTQLIAAQPGEVVINAKAAENFGVDKLLTINQNYGGPVANKPRDVASNKIKAMASGGYAGGKIKYFSVNGGGNKLLNSGQTYIYSDLRMHHSGPTTRRTDGYPKDYTILHGTDLASAPNADIPVPLDSEVIYKDKAGGYGNTVVVKNATGNMLFAHLSRMGNFGVGDKIKAGTIIGTQGSTGGNYADHLHMDAEPAGHEAFVNYITSGKPTFGSTSAAGKSSSGEMETEMSRSGSLQIPSAENVDSGMNFLGSLGPVPGQMKSGGGVANTPNQKSVSSFSSIDPTNPSLLVVKSIYNLVG